MTSSHTMNLSAYYLKSLLLFLFSSLPFGAHTATSSGKETIVSVRYALHVLMHASSIVCPRKFAETET